MIAALISGDAEEFYAQETEERRRGGLPPFGRLAAIIVSAEDRGAAEAHARGLARAAHALPEGKGWRVAPLGGQPRDNEIVLLGPAEAPMRSYASGTGSGFPAKAPRSADLQGFLRAIARRAAAARRGAGFDRRRSQSFL